MSQHLLDGKDITAGFQVVCGETVTQSVDAAGTGDPGSLFGLIIDFLRGSSRYRVVLILSGEEPDRGMAELPVVS